MGRKPHPIILQYFDRGSKLEDASNRYQHSCKQCGEQFPKGRIDSLITHLTKKCSAFTVDERREVLLRLHNVPSADPQAGSTILQNSENVNLPFSPSRQFDRLNVLAEASRQVGATNDPTRSGVYTTPANGDGLALDPALQNALQEEDFFNSQDYYTTKPGNYSGAAAVALPPLPQPFARSGTDLLSIAASANETLANDMPSDFGSSNDQDPANFLNGINQFALGINHNGMFADSSIAWSTPPQASTHDNFVDLSLDQKLNDEQRAASFPRPIAINPNTPASGTGLPGNFGSSGSGPLGKAIQKSNIRKRFDPDRRREVQKLRKMGACIRCRTLKKPCSEETPCLTCQSVEGPRLWREPCTRARLADSFSLYTAGLLSTLAHRDVSQIKATLQFYKSPISLELSHFDDFHTKITLNAVQGQRPAPAMMNGFSNHTPVMLVDRESSDFTKKIEEYLEAVAPTLVDQEQSHFMNVTLKLAAELSASKQDVLLRKTLDLWTATQLLSDVELGWKIASVQESGINKYRSTIDESNNPHSHALISGQLRGAVEKRAEYLSKFVMQKLEKRFIEPHKNNQFETFLIAMILLNCVERISWLFCTWENELSATRWPLERTPEFYTSQGDSFSDVLHMLLRVRTLIPRTTLRPDDGILRTFDKSSDEAATKWFESIGITKQALQQCLATQFSPVNSRSLDGRYFAKVLV